MVSSSALLSVLAIASASQVSAFAPTVQQSRTSTTAVFAEQLQTRQSFLKYTSSLVASTALVSLFGDNAANAATYGGFGAGSTASLDPKDAEYDSDIMSSKTVQAAINKIKDYREVVKTMRAKLDGDSQINVRPYIVKELDFASLRENMNVFNSAFEEDTQRSTDRLIRVIMQDITELEIANKQKDDIPRSPRRVETMKSKLSKLEQAFDDILAFAK